jgi:hypothetical protein
MKMKKLRVLSILLLAIVMVAGCKKKEETPILDATTEEAASIMATSFCTGNAGTLTQVEDAVELAQNEIMKTPMYDSSFTVTSLPGAVISYQYQVNYAYGFLNPNNYQLAYDADGNYSSPNVNATVTANGSLNVTDFLSASSYLVTGQSGREGSFTMKIGNHSSITGTVTTTLDNFRVSKTTGLAESGGATIVVNGATGAGRTFGFTGTLVYTGNYTGTLTINGELFSVNLTTGTFQ